MSEPSKPSLDDHFLTASILACIAAWLAAIGIVCWQALTWLRYARWPHLTIADALQLAGSGPPRFTWMGVQRLSDWLCGLPLALALPLAGVLLVWFAEENRKSSTGA